MFINLLGEMNTVVEFIGSVEDSIKVVVTVAFAIMAAFGTVFAIYIGIRLAQAEDDGKRKEAKAQLLWAMIAVIGMVAVIAVKNWDFGGAFDQKGIVENYALKLSEKYGEDYIAEAGELAVGIASAVNTVVQLGGVALAALGLWIGVRLVMAEDEGKRKEAKKQVIWCVIGVVFSIVFSTALVQIMGLIIDNILNRSSAFFSLAFGSVG